jgi:hypothetical protein
MTTLQLMRDLHTVCRFQSAERNGVATSSEIGRWIKNNSVIVNGKKAALTDEHDTITSLILFPKSKRKTTLK